MGSSSPNKPEIQLQAYIVVDAQHASHLGFRDVEGIEGEGRGGKSRYDPGSKFGRHLPKRGFGLAMESEIGFELKSRLSCFRGRVLESDEPTGNEDRLRVLLHLESPPPDVAVPPLIVRGQRGQQDADL